MSGLLARAGEFFVAAPPAIRTADASAPSRPVMTAGVLAAADALAALATATATALRRRARADAAAVCLPRGLLLTGPPPLRAAARVARRLAARGLEASAVGAACIVALPEDPEAAVRDAWRTIAAAPVPVVIATATRGPQSDALLREVDLLVLGRREADDPLVAELALASLAELGPPVRLVAAQPGALARQAAAWGLLAADLDGKAEPAAEAVG